MLSAFTIGATVMLLKSFVVELKLMNGSIGTIVDIVYKEEDGPRGGHLPAYVVVDFQNCIMKDDEFKWRRQEAHTRVPIPIVKDYCEKKCCSITTIPLRICKAISIHKGQGITVDENQHWKSVIVYFVEEGGKSQPGLELVALSRAKSPNDLFIGTPSSKLSRDKLMKVGRGAAYDKRTSFENYLKQMALSSQKPIVEAITKLDTETNDELKTFEGGCRFLCDWYRYKYQNTNNGDTYPPNNFKFKDVIVPVYSEIESVDVDVSNHKDISHVQTLLKKLPVMKTNKVSKSKTNNKGQKLMTNFFTQIKKDKQEKKT